MSEIKKNFWMDLAIYKGEEFMYLSYANDKIELFDKEDIFFENVLYTVTTNDLEDKYTKIIRGILGGIEYVVYEIDDENVTYKRIVNDNEFINKSISEFDLIYAQYNHHYNDTNFTENVIIYIDEKRLEKEAVNRRFWPEEMACGNIMLSAVEDILSINDLGDALNALYGSRISGKGGIPDALIWDEYIAWLSIDGIKFDITLDFGIVTISPRDFRGNEYIREIVDYLNRKVQ